MAVDNAVTNVELAAAGVEMPQPAMSLRDKALEILSGKDSAPPADPPEKEAPAEPIAAEKPAPEKAAEKPATLKDLAERLKVDPAELYGVKLKVSDDTELTLGELKDQWKPAKELVRQRGEFEADRLRQDRELSNLLAAIPKEAITPQAVQAFEAYRTERRSRETEALLRAIPEWADQTVLQTDKAKLTSYLEADNWPAGTVDLIEDHRLFRTLKRGMDAANRVKELEAKLAKLEQPKPKMASAPHGSKPTREQEFGRLKAAVTKGQISRGDAARQLLKGLT